MSITCAASWNDSRNSSTAIPRTPGSYTLAGNSFQKRHGDVAAVQLSLAIDTLKILHAVHDRLRARKDDGIGGLIVVFHIALMELVERGHYIGFPQWLLARLKDDDAPLPTEATVAAMKEYLKAQKQDYESEHGAAKAVIRALQQGLLCFREAGTAPRVQVPRSKSAARNAARGRVRVSAPALSRIEGRREIRRPGVPVVPPSSRS